MLLVLKTVRDVKVYKADMIQSPASLNTQKSSSSRNLMMMILARKTMVKNMKYQLQTLRWLRALALKWLK